MKVRYTRLDSDAAGVSHLGDIEAEFSIRRFPRPAPPVKFSWFLPATRLAFFIVVQLTN
jgi:hypothetical protein